MHAHACSRTHTQTHARARTHARTLGYFSGTSISGQGLSRGRWLWAQHLVGNLQCLYFLGKKKEVGDEVGQNPSLQISTRRHRGAGQIVEDISHTLLIITKNASPASSSFCLNPLRGPAQKLRLWHQKPQV